MDLIIRQIEGTSGTRFGKSEIGNNFRGSLEVTSILFALRVKGEEGTTTEETDRVSMT